MNMALLQSDVIWLGTRYKRLHSDPQGLSLFESLCPAGSGPPRHIHHREDETFYILSGSIDFWMNGERLRRGPGDVVHVPRGIEHAFRVHDGGPANMLTVLTPGGFDGFFVEMARHQCRIPDDMGQVMAIAEAYNLTFTGPPLEAA